MWASYRLWLLIVLLGATSCAQVAKVRQCRRAVQLVNGERANLERLAQQKTPAAYRTAAVSYEKLAKELRRLGFSEFAGKAVTEEYATTLEEIAPSVSGYADALEQGDQRQQDAARRTVERNGRQERAAATRLEGYCRAR